MADGFSRALQDISRDLNFVRRGTQLCNSAEMKSLVVLLYKDVFAFLCHSMKWYSSPKHRFWTSLNNRFYDKNVEQRVKGIQGLVQRVRDEMSLLSDRLVQDMHWEQRTGFDEIKNHIDRGLDARFERLVQIIGAQTSETLKANAQQLSPRSAVSWDPGSIPTIPNEIATDIQRWLQPPDSDILWVEGPAYGPFDQALSSIGIRIQSATEEVDIHCISFFARTTYSFEAQLGSIKNAGIISMIYSVVNQLISIAPSSLPNNPGLAEDKLQQLDGTLKSIPASLGIMQALLSHMEPGLVVVICGFNLVDSRENLLHLTEFVEILRDQPPEQRIKTLFISAGNCRALAGCISRSKRSDASRLTLARTQRPLPGGVDVSSIRL
ncbi:hypothetical protein PG996_010777 [Apiospora saccharicola]|uniref:DUF7708 domain-containing protein n=1 Tax=Apiospora saccharicola TaxID=335842 RepID=A0ABR1UQ77_9PEZI